jgi:hypothetical protein
MMPPLSRESRFDHEPQVVTGKGSRVKVQTELSIP